MFVHGRGPLHDFLAGLGRPMDDCGHGAVRPGHALTAAGCLGPECIAVHLNEWEEEDFALVAPGGPLAGMTVVHCPLSHRYFRHQAFPLERLRGLAVNLCVGTDSPASDGSFSCSRNCAPWPPSRRRFDPRERLETITLAPRPARWVSIGRLGCIRPGAWADLIALPCRQRRDAGNIHAEVLACHAPGGVVDGSWPGYFDGLALLKKFEKENFFLSNSHFCDYDGHVVQSDFR